MSRIAAFDAWLGRRVFHPPIIWVCQRARITQWAFYRYAWWIAALWIVGRDDHTSTLQSVWLVIFALIRTLSAGLALNRPATSSRLLRMVFLTFAVLDALMAARLHRVTASLCTDLLVLLAEYATTIVTIPPRRERQRVTSRKAVTT